MTDFYAMLSVEKIMLIIVLCALRVLLVIKGIRCNEYYMSYKNEYSL